MRRNRSRHVGSTLDDFLLQDGTYGVATAAAFKSVLAWKLRKAMKERRLTKSGLANRMETSRSAVDRLLDPENQSVTLCTMARAATALGKHLELDLVDASGPR